MSYLKSTYHSRIYRDFKEIEVTAYRQVIHFYEKKEIRIRQLDFDEYFEMLVAYVNALFEVGAYQKHLLMVDLVIEATIVHHTDISKGEDLFKKMLFKKAASHFNLLEYDRAEYILRELIRIDPHDPYAIMLLKKCLRKKKSSLVDYTRAISIFLFLMTAFILFIEVLFVRTFYRMHVDLVESSRISTFVLGCSAGLSGDLIQRWRVEQKVGKFVAEAKRQQKF